MQNENAQCRMQNAECAMNQVLLCALSIAHCALLVQQHDETARYGCESAPNYTGKKKGATPQFHVVALLEIRNWKLGAVIPSSVRNLQSLASSLRSPITIMKDISLDLSRLLANPNPNGAKAIKNTQPRNDRPEGQTLDDALFLASKRAVDEKKPMEFKAAIHNTDRTVGARLAGYIAQKYGDAGLPQNTIVATFEGSAGQSFGAFCINGMQLKVF